MSSHADLPLAVPAGDRKFHPVIWMLLYVPFGALGGFITIALAFLATQHGLSISEGAWIGGAQMLTQWLKWLWAPVVDITLNPKRWYVLSTGLSALGVFTMSAVPLGKDHLTLLLVVIAAASLINSVVGMSVEAMIASLTKKDEVGKISAWFQAGNLGGNGLGGGLGLFLIQKLPAPWMSGAIMGGLFMLCCLALRALPHVPAHTSGKTAGAAVAEVAGGLWGMLKTRIGFLSAFLCLLPIGTGAAQGTLVQAKVAAYWGATDTHVELVQGLLAGLITAIGCFAGGWVCDRLNARATYAFFGLILAGIATAMAFLPNTIAFYVGGNMVYAFGVGLAYAAFTAVALTALGGAAAATGYNVFASLSNFPIWWLGLLLGWMADPTQGPHHGPTTMLLTEAGLGVLGVLLFFGVTKAAGQSFLERPNVEPGAVGAGA